MTAPATPAAAPVAAPEAAPKAPTAEPQPPAAAAPAPATPAAPAAPAPSEKKSLEDSLASLDADTKAFVLGELDKARREAQGLRGAKTKAVEDARTELAQSIGKALGLVPDDQPVDPAVLTEQLTATAADAKQAKVELAVFKAAKDVADPVALLDSMSFRAKLADVDPTDHAAVLAAVTAAVADNPAFGTAAAPASRLPGVNKAQGTSSAGQPDLETEIAAAKKTGDWQKVVALENQKLLNPIKQ